MVGTAKPRSKPERPEQAATPDHTSESRFDPLTGNWTIFAPHRDQRPEEFLEQRERVSHQLRCPFCPGNENATPPPVWVGRISEHDSSIDILNPSRMNAVSYTHLTLPTN